MNSRSLLAMWVGASLVLPAAAQQDVAIEGSLVQVTDESYDEYHPRIDGDLVVFTATIESSQSIVLADLGTGERRQITTGPGDQRLQDVSGRRIVYTDYSGSAHEVFVYELDTEVSEPVSEEPGSRDFPAIKGELVTYVQVGSDRRSKIWIADLSAGLSIAVTADSDAVRRPTVFGDFVAFERTVDGDSIIFLHDLRDGSEIAVVPGAANQRRPHIEGGRLIFDAFVDGRSVRDLVAYEIETGAVHHFPAEGHQSFARISGDWVGFDDDALGSSDIVLLHLPTGFTHRITGPESIDYFNDIDGNRVVFTSNAAGKFDIWLFEFEVVSSGDEDDPGDGDFPGVGEGLQLCDWTQWPDREAIFEETITRSAGPPNVDVHVFEGDGPALAVIQNHGCAAGWITLNDEPLLVPSDIDPNVTCLAGTVLLQGANTLVMKLASVPGCSMDLALFALDEEDAAYENGGEGVFHYLSVIPELPIACETGSGAAWVAFALVLFGLLFTTRRPRRVRVRKRTGGFFGS